MTNMPTGSGRPTMGRPFALVSSTGGGSVTPNAAQRVAAWYIDPAGTSGGNDSNNGTSTATPIKSIAEWRRRIAGARYGSGGGFPTNPVIHALSGSVVPDDGLFYGFTTESQTAFVQLLGVPTVIGTGTVTAYTPYVGNARGSLTDAAIPISWTASGFLTTTARSRFIRKTGGGVQHYAPVLLDLGAKAVQLGTTTDINDAALNFFPSQVETNFAVNDAYEVVGYFTWPALQVANLITISPQCLDLNGLLPTPGMSGYQRQRLCGILGNTIYSAGGGGFNAYMCVASILQPAGINLVGSDWLYGNCAFLNTLIQSNQGGPDLVTAAKNVFINGVNRFWNGAKHTWGNARYYDFTGPLFDIEFNSSLYVGGSCVGSNNTGKLVLCAAGGVLHGASNVTATTTDANPYSVSGIAYPTPTVDGNTGDGIYQ